MFDGNVYYCWTCDAHRRAAAAPTGSGMCPKCGEKFTEENRLTSVREPDHRPIFALAIGHPVASSAPAWTGAVAAAS